MPQARNLFSRLFLCALCVSAVSLQPPARASEIASLVKKARGFSDEGRYDLALPAWQEAVAKMSPSAGAGPAPRFMEALIEAGISASMVKRYDVAHQYLDRAAALGPQDSRALLNLGLLCFRERNFPRAEEILHRTLAVDPACVDANLHLGIIAEEQGNLALAKEYYVKEVNILGGTNRAWGRLFSLQSREPRPRGGISTTTAILFFVACMIIAGALMALHRYRTLRSPLPAKPRVSSL